MLNVNPEWPPWEQVYPESAEVKTIWCQHPNLKVRDGILLWHCRDKGSLDDWQIVMLQTIQSKILQPCHHHRLPGHQGIVCTLALIKRMGDFKHIQNDDYNVVMQEHFTKWVDGRAIFGKGALTVADAVVQEWIPKQFHLLLILSSSLLMILFAPLLSVSTTDRLCCRSKIRY